MNISKPVLNLMILHLSIAANEARKNAEMFATFQGDYSSLVSQFHTDAEQLEQGITALRLQEMGA